MGVDWLSCDNCGDTFPDCGDFVSCHCDCSSRWCDERCAEGHGHVRATCKAGCDISSEGYLECGADICLKTKDNENYDDEYICCNGCENYIEESCKYCREEDYEDTDLLEKALELLNVTREDLILKMKGDN